MFTFTSSAVQYNSVTLAVLLSWAWVSKSLRCGEKDATRSFSASSRNVHLSKWATNLINYKKTWLWVKKLRMLRSLLSGEKKKKTLTETDSPGPSLQNTHNCVLVLNNIFREYLKILNRLGPSTHTDICNPSICNITWLHTWMQMSCTQTFLFIVMSVRGPRR